MRSRSELIRKIARDPAPDARWRGPLQLALLWWFGAWIFVVAVTLAVQPMRPGFGAQLLASPRFAFETLLGVAAGGMAIGTAFALGIPGWGSTRRRIAAAMALLAFWIGMYCYGLANPALEASMLGKRPHCFVEVLIYGVPALVAGLLLLRRLAPLGRCSAGFVVGAAAGAIPALLMQLACVYIPSHILAFHIAPAFAVALIGALAGRLLLREI
ncbi:MAG: DUF1109 family protein [Deltaproteobacteria bacterium]|nr:DUF1109 family protein [Deltaproteobacteria bacterium]MBW2541640.1 DUF1109 family protein [Deltaproteobacteria bacterium]